MRIVPDTAEPDFEYVYHSPTCECVEEGCGRHTPLGNVIQEQFSDLLINDVLQPTLNTGNEHGVLLYRKPTDSYMSITEGEWTHTDVVVGTEKKIEFPDLPSHNITSPVYIHTHPHGLGKKTRTFSPKDLVGKVPGGDRALGEYSQFTWRGFGLLFANPTPENVCDNVPVSTPTDGWIKMLERNWRTSIDGVLMSDMTQTDVGRAWRHSDALNEDRETARNRLMGVLDDKVTRTVTPLQKTK